MIDLMSRKSDGIEVTLFWDKEEGLILNVTDRDGGFTVPVPDSEGMEAFDHPYIYREPSYVPTFSEIVQNQNRDDLDDEWGALA